MMPPLAELATGMAWCALGLAAAAACWGAVRFAKSMVAYRRWRRRVERADTSGLRVEPEDCE